MAAEVQVVLATRELAEALAPLLRDGDVEEGKALGLNPREALLESVERSEMAFAVLFDGEVAAMFGARTLSETVLARQGLVWMLSGRAVDKHPRAFLSVSRRLLEQLLTHWDVLTNVIDARYAGAVRWARWLGLQLEPPVPLGPYGVPFHRFTVGR